MIPALRLLSVRFLLVLAAFVFPIATITYLQVSQFNHAVAAIDIERGGVRCLTRVYAAVGALAASETRADPRAVANLNVALTALRASTCRADTTLARLSAADLRDPRKQATLARELNHAMNVVAERTMWDDSTAVTAHATDASAYALADAVPLFVRAAMEPNRIVAAKTQATAASRLRMLDYDVSTLVKAAPWTASFLSAPHARLEPGIQAYFSALDRWEQGTREATPDVRVPLHATLEATDEIFAALMGVLDTNLARELEGLQQRRTGIIAAAALALGLALTLVWQIARTVARGHHREIARLTEVALEEARFQAIFAGSPLPIAITTPNGIVLEHNEAYLTLVGTAPVQTGGTPLFEPWRPSNARDIASLLRPLRETNVPSVDLELTLTRSDTLPMACHAIATVVRPPGDDAAYCTVILQDVTERRRRERHLRHETTHDTLTGIANRAALLEGLQARLNDPTEACPRFALLFIDVDDFKTINDTLGHAAGDACLQAVAERLESVVRAEDLVARFGGDEFAILLCERESIAYVDEIAARLRRDLTTPIALDAIQMSVSSSIGIAIDSGGAADAEAIIAAADRAMYVDKKRREKQAACIRLPAHP